MFGRTQGFIAALLLLSSPLVFIEAPIAKTDRHLCHVFYLLFIFLQKLYFDSKFKDTHYSKYLILLHG